jgi:glycosyltransferase involved in cell wall biosynthesis
MSDRLRVALLSPVAWRTPPRHYGPWERVVSLLTEGLVERGVQVTLFATADSETRARLVSVVRRGYEEDPDVCAKVCECLHISEVFERADRFDLIHNHFDFLPLTYSRLVETPVLATIHGFSSPKILPVYEKYNGHVSYVSISDADRSPTLDYVATVHHGIDIERFTFRSEPDDYLLFFGRIHPDKGAREAIQIARHAGRRLILAGIVQDAGYFRDEVEPHLDGTRVTYVGSVGPERRDQLLGGAVALLHPISFAEPFGLSVVEAMATGTPVVAFARGSMAELIQHGSNGFLVQSVDEAVTAVQEVATLDRRVCRRHAEQNFSAARMVDDYLRVYHTVLGRDVPLYRQ